MINRNGILFKCTKCDQSFLLHDNLNDNHMIQRFYIHAILNHDFYLHNHVTPLLDESWLRNEKKARVSAGAEVSNNQTKSDFFVQLSSTCKIRYDNWGSFLFVPFFGIFFVGSLPRAFVLVFLILLLFHDSPRHSPFHPVNNTLCYWCVRHSIMVSFSIVS